MIFVAMALDTCQVEKPFSTTPPVKLLHHQLILTSVQRANQIDCLMECLCFLNFVT